MHYYKDNVTWKFSEEQILSEEGSSELLSEYYDLPRKYMSMDVRDLNRNFYGIKEPELSPEKEAAKRKRAMIGIILGMLVFASLIVALIIKEILIFGFIFSAVFLFAGVSMIFTGKGSIVESASRACINRILGVFISLGAAAIILLLLFRSHFSGAEVSILMGTILFGLSGIALPLVFILKAFSGKFIYTEEVHAVCKGYVRCVDRSEGSNHMMHTFIQTSPLFSYTYNGVQYEAVYDEFETKKNSDIALGQTVPIRIDPRHPEGIQSPVVTHPGVIIFACVMGLLFLGATVFMGTYLAKGSAKNMTVETKWNPEIYGESGESESVSTKLQITDAMMEEAFAEDIKGADGWYCELATVSGHEEAQNGIRESYTDEAFCSVICPKGKEHEVGKQILVFYTVDQDLLSEGGIGYKRIFTFGDPDEVDYIGSHGAYPG